MKGQKYNTETRAFIAKSYEHGYKIHHFTKVFKISSATVWRIVKAVKGKLVYRRLKIDGIKQRLHQQTLKDHFINLITWQIYKDKYGIFDLDKVCKGERPP